MGLGNLLRYFDLFFLDGEIIEAEKFAQPLSKRNRVLVRLAI